MALFTYYVPHDATYNAHDITKILNNEWVHSTLAKNKGSFYSAGTTCEAMVIPAIILTAITAVGASIAAAAVTDDSKSQNSTSSNTFIYYNGGSGRKYTDLDIPDNYYTATEVVYMLNTHDIWGTLHHQVPINYHVPLSGDAWKYAAVLD